MGLKHRLVVVSPQLCPAHMKSRHLFLLSWSTAVSTLSIIATDTVWGNTFRMTNLVFYNAKSNADTFTWVLKTINCMFHPWGLHHTLKGFWHLIISCSSYVLSCLLSFNNGSSVDSSTTVVGSIGDEPADVRLMLILRCCWGNSNAVIWCA